MSDIILKFFPKINPDIDKTQDIVSMLEAKGIIGSSKIYFDKKAYEPGEHAAQYLAPGFSVSLAEAYDSTNISFVIAAHDYGVKYGEEDSGSENYPKTMNVFSIWGGDGSLERSEAICGFLEEATGDEYVSEFEIL